MTLDKHIGDFYKIIEEVLSQMDPEAARQFVESFTEKLNEQKRIKKDSGTPR